MRISSGSSKLAGRSAALAGVPALLPVDTRWSRYTVDGYIVEQGGGDRRPLRLRPGRAREGPARGERLRHGQFGA